MNYEDFFVDITNNQIFVAEEATKKLGANESDTQGQGGDGPNMSNDTIDQKRIAIINSFKDPKRRLWRRE